jgi:hypothetical protein
MGGGSSSFDNTEDLLATTYLIGRAIAAITFPGMFRIYDFHSPLAPRIRNSQPQFAFFSNESDSDEDNRPDPALYQHLFHVAVGDDVVYIEYPFEANECGWTPLHACCMSFVTVPAGLALLDEYEKRHEGLETKTIAGPGTFNSGWTALHM